MKKVFQIYFLVYWNLFNSHILLIAFIDAIYQVK